MMREDTVFGPIQSRRLGSSLGINLLPRNGKLSNFDCIYCECGWNRDGLQEILFSSHDGRMHCFSLDGTEHGAWPYALSSRADGDSLSFATKPAVADLNGDGKLEVIFASYTENDQVERRGKLFVLDFPGRLLADEVRPPMWGLTGDQDIYYADGAMATPAVADVDGDGLPEIVVTTMNCGVCVYDVSLG